MPSFRAIVFLVTATTIATLTSAAPISPPWTKPTNANSIAARDRAIGIDALIQDQALAAAVDESNNEPVAPPAIINISSASNGLAADLEGFPGSSSTPGNLNTRSKEAEPQVIKKDAIAIAPTPAVGIITTLEGLSAGVSGLLGKRDAPNPLLDIETAPQGLSIGHDGLSNKRDAPVADIVPTSQELASGVQGLNAKNLDIGTVLHLLGLRDAQGQAADAKESIDIGTVLHLLGLRATPGTGVVGRSSAKEAVDVGTVLHLLGLRYTHGEAGVRFAV
ncbi:hypothetical protein H0H87_002334 [Tephrocybe sp. NHM501043]|nr:hypothetical protein H0H87_002334 [Tephrocybe sp. NHM501043]